MARGNLNLDVQHPDQVPGVLRRAAQAFGEADAELQAAWQQGPTPWDYIARRLETVADQIERRFVKGR